MAGEDKTRTSRRKIPPKYTLNRTAGTIKHVKERRVFLTKGQNTRQDQRRRDNTREDETRQDKTRQDKTR
jgi:hypothetical protein